MALQPAHAPAPAPVAAISALIAAATGAAGTAWAATPESPVPPPMALVIAGPPASGKASLAAAICNCTGLEGTTAVRYARAAVAQAPVDLLFVARDALLQHVSHFLGVSSSRTQPAAVLFIVIADWCDMGDMGRGLPGRLEVACALASRISLAHVVVAATKSDWIDRATGKREEVIDAAHAYLAQMAATHGASLVHTAVPPTPATTTTADAAKESPGVRVLRLFVQHVAAGSLPLEFAPGIAGSFVLGSGPPSLASLVEKRAEIDAIVSRFAILHHDLCEDACGPSSTTAGAGEDLPELPERHSVFLERMRSLMEPRTYDLPARTTSEDAGANGSELINEFFNKVLQNSNRPATSSK